MPAEVAAAPVLVKGDVVLVPEGCTVSPTETRTTPTRLPKDVTAVVCVPKLRNLLWQIVFCSHSALFLFTCASGREHGADAISMGNLDVRLRAPIDIGEARYRRLTVQADDVCTLKLAPSKTAMTWRLKGLVFAIAWVLLPGAAIAGGVAACVALYVSGSSGTGVGLSYLLFIGVPILMTIVRAIYVHRVRDETICGMGCLTIFLISWLAFCLPPTLGVLEAGQLSQQRLNVAKGGAAAGVSAASAPANEASRLTFAASTYVDVANGGAFHEQFTRRTFDRYFCLAPLRSGKSTGPVLYWAFEAKLLARAEEDAAKPSGPCWDGYEAISSPGTSHALQAVSIGMNRYIRLTGVTNISSDVARAKSEAIKRHGLTEDPSAQVVSIEAALEGPLSLAHLLDAGIQHAVFWSVATGPLVLLFFGAFYWLLNCTDGLSRGRDAGRTASACCAMYGDRQTCVPIMCAQGD